MKWGTAPLLEPGILVPFLPQGARLCPRFMIKGTNVPLWAFGPVGTAASNAECGFHGISFPFCLNFEGHFALVPEGGETICPD